MYRVVMTPRCEFSRRRRFRSVNRMWPQGFRSTAFAASPLAAAIARTSRSAHPKSQRRRKSSQVTCPSIQSTWLLRCVQHRVRTFGAWQADTSRQSFTEVPAFPT